MTTQVNGSNGSINGSTSRVFFLEKPRQNVEEAKEFGAIDFIFPRDAEHASIWKGEEFTADILQRLDELRFDPDADYIAVTGNMVPLTTLIAAVAATWGQFRVLCWDWISKDYVAVTVGIGEELENG